MSEKRAQNFSDFEIRLLLEEIVTNKAILLSAAIKDDNTDLLKKKNAVWKEIATKLSFTTLVQRDFHKYRKKWHDLKSEVLKTHHEKGVRGGKPRPKSPYHDIVMRILGYDNVTGVNITDETGSESGEPLFFQDDAVTVSLSAEHIRSASTVSSTDSIVNNHVEEPLVVYMGPHPLPSSMIATPDTFKDSTGDNCESGEGDNNMQSAPRFKVEKASSQKRKRNSNGDQLLDEYMRAGTKYYEFQIEKAELEMDALRRKTELEVKILKLQYVKLKQELDLPVKDEDFE